MNRTAAPADDDSVEALLGSGLGAIVSIFVAAGLVPFRTVLATRDVALVLVGIVAAAAAAGGWLAGAVTTATSATGLAFFHTRPYLSLSVDGPTDRETLLVLGLVGVAVAVVVPLIRRARPWQAQDRAVRSVQRVSSLVAAGEGPVDVILAAEAELTDLLRLQECRFESRPYASLGPVLPRLERSGVVDVHEHWFGRGGLELPRTGVELPVVAKGREVGHFVLMPQPGEGVPPDARVAAVGLADLVGAALAVGKDG